MPAAYDRLAGPRPVRHHRDVTDRDPVPAGAEPRTARAPAAARALDAVDPGRRRAGRRAADAVRAVRLCRAVDASCRVRAGRSDPRARGPRGHPGHAPAGDDPHRLAARVLAHMRSASAPPAASSGGGRSGRMTGAGEEDLAAAADRLRARLADGPQDVKELGDMAKGFVGTHGLWVDLVRVPPAGTWERRRADRIGLAEEWVGPPDTTEAGRTDASGPGVPARVRPGRLGRHRVVGRLRPQRRSRQRRAISSWLAIETRQGASSSTCRAQPLPDPKTCRHPSGSCRTGTPTCSSMRAGPGCCRSRSGRGSSRRRTRSRSGRTSWMASSPERGRCATAASSSIPSREVPADVQRDDRARARGARGVPRLTTWTRQTCDASPLPYSGHAIQDHARLGRQDRGGIPRPARGRRGARQGQAPTGRRDDQRLLVPQHGRGLRRRVPHRRGSRASSASRRQRRRRDRGRPRARHGAARGRRPEPTSLPPSRRRPTHSGSSSRCPTATSADSRCRSRTRSPPRRASAGSRSRSSARGAGRT